MNRHVPALAVALLFVTSECVGGIRAPTHDYSDDQIVQTVTGSDFDHRDVSALYERHWRLTRNASSMRGTTTMWRDGEVIRETVKAFDRSRPAVLTRSTRYENGTRVRQQQSS